MRRADAHQPRQERDRRERRDQQLARRRHESDLRPPAQIPVDEPGAHLQPHPVAVSRAGRIDPLDLGDRWREVRLLQLPAGAEVSRRQDHAATGQHVQHRAVRGSRLHPRHPLALREQSLRRHPEPHLHAAAPGVAREVIDVGPGVGQDVVHARVTVGRLRHGTEELQAQPHEPLERRRGFVRQEPAQLEVVPIAEPPPLIEEPHVFEELFRGILHPLSALVGGPAGGNGTDRQQRGAAELRLLFQEDHAPPAVRSLQRRGEPGAPAAHDDDVRLDLAFGAHGMPRSSAHSTFAATHTTVQCRTKHRGDTQQGRRRRRRSPAAFGLCARPRPSPAANRRYGAQRNRGGDTNPGLSRAALSPKIYTAWGLFSTREKRQLLNASAARDCASLTRAEGGRGRSPLGTYWERP